MVSEREGNAEETYLAPDVQVDGVLFLKTPETRHSKEDNQSHLNSKNNDFPHVEANLYVKIDIHQFVMYHCYIQLLNIF